MLEFLGVRPLDLFLIGGIVVLFILDGLAWAQIISKKSYERALSRICQRHGVLDCHRCGNTNKEI